MTIKDQLTAIKTGLKAWQTQYTAQVHIAHDVPHLFRILGGNPGVPRAGILFAGETTRNELLSDVIGRVDRKFWVAISRGYDLEAWKGKSLIEGVAGGAPMFDLLSDARDTLRALVFTDGFEPNPFYKGIELLTFEGVTMDAYRIEIEVAGDIADNNNATGDPPQ